MSLMKTKQMHNYKQGILDEFFRMMEDICHGFQLMETYKPHAHEVTARVKIN